ncbi:metallophosphoesterase [Methylobacterium crusticola]|uniref:metallophosphoesterase n=1 Tax=Methylobacterium crusticola TaxID=1697972 RepID=UPI001396B425|nr:metallophosphoesterase [Methylobacterium crusticola]
MYDLEWEAIRRAIDPLVIRSRIRSVVEGMEELLDRAGGTGMLFDNDRADASDRAIRVADEASRRDPFWIIGDMHGDLLALEAALAVIQAEASQGGSKRQRVIFLGDFFDDEGYGLELLLRIFELILESPEHICVVVGNHDEALSYDGTRFTSSVSPCDFSDYLNANIAHEWIERAGKLAVRLFAQAPRALFFSDGLLVSHGGFPLSDLHAGLSETGNWNDPACLADFVWTRVHPKARKKLPNRFSRGSQFGYEDFAAFCALSTSLGRPVRYLIRGHDHVENRYEIYPAYRAHPVLTTVALSRRLPREAFGPRERVPTLIRVVENSWAQVIRMHIPVELIHDAYPEPNSVTASDDDTGNEAKP